MPQKNVYFLGAGASAASDFPLPVMKGFFREKDFPKRGRKYHNLRTLLTTLYPNINKTHFDEINLENVITHLELTIEGFNWELANPLLFEARKELYKYIKFRIGNPIKDNICDKHLRLINNMNLYNDSIITVNYDLIVDNILNSPVKIKKYKRISHDLIRLRVTSLGLKPVANFKNKENGFYIKLHGSLNWIYCPSSDCLNNRYFWPATNSGEPCYACGTSVELAIVPPTMKKSFEKFPKLGFLWHVAFNKLKEANKIIVIGMSFPDSDYYLKWLVRQAMMERSAPPDLVIVNPDIKKDEFLNKYKTIFGVSPAETHNGLDDYLKHLQI